MKWSNKNISFVSAESVLILEIINRLLIQLQEQSPSPNIEPADMFADVEVFKFS